MLELISLGLMVAALWALGPILNKLVLVKGVSSTTIIVIGGIFSLVFGILCLIFKRKELIKDIEKLDIETLILISSGSIICGIFASYIFLHILGKYDSYLVNALAYTSPIFTVVFTLWILGEPVSWISVFGMFLILTGVIVTVVGSHYSKKC